MADGTGGHAFAETLDQHRANVESWRKIEKARKEDAEAAAIADAKAEPDDATADAAAAAAEAGPAPTSQQPELPMPEEMPQFSAGNAQPAEPEPTADATSNDAAASPVPEGEPMPDLAALVEENKELTAAAEPNAAVAPEPVVEAVLKPGDVVTVAKKLVPIPVPKPKQ